MITFDDGYANNQYALTVLKEYKVPGIFFTCANNVLYNKCFWWDVLYRERKQRGGSEDNIREERRYLKVKKIHEIEKYLKNEFGEESFHPRGDIDRPFTVKELRSLSEEMLVCVGNHTSDHAILTNYSRAEIKAQVTTAQEIIHSITRTIPQMIAYPNGKYSKEVIEVCQESGLCIGFTTEPGKTYLPIERAGSRVMSLGRFTLWGNRCIRNQCEGFRSDVRMSSHGIV